MQDELTLNSNNLLASDCSIDSWKREVAISGSDSPFSFNPLLMHRTGFGGGYSSPTVDFEQQEECSPTEAITQSIVEPMGWLSRQGNFALATSINLGDAHTNKVESDVLTGALEDRSSSGDIGKSDPLTQFTTTDELGQVAAIPDNAGNTLATARNITVGATTTTYNDWVGSTDTNDYYRFNLNSQSNFNLTLNGLSADADVQLLNSSGVAIGSSSLDGTAAETLTRTLDAGTYYIRVYPYSGNTAYNLAVSASSISIPDNAGNTLSTARNITVGSTTTTYSDWVGSTDSNDYYRFSLNSQSNFNLTLNGLSADADVQVLNSSGTVIGRSENDGTAPESLTGTLNAGTYYIRVYPYSGNTAYNLSLSATNASSDWFEQNIRDAGLCSAARSCATDNVLSRNDMIAIFRNAEDGSVIDATEFTDLQTLVNNASRFNMPDYVRVLSNKIANGNVANQWYQGNRLGNLYVGSSATHMENLIGKWFLGTDRPSAPSGFTMTYQRASGSLFGNDGTFSYRDIDQNDLGDCYFLASLAATARQRPSAIQNMFINNGDGTFTVRFFGQYNGTVNTGADYVTVDTWLPTNVSGYDNGQLYTGQRFAGYDNGNLGLWVALAEKAYAQFAESGLAQRVDNFGRTLTTNSYGSIVGGWGYRALPAISGVSSGYYADTSSLDLGPRQGNFLSLSQIASMLASGRAMTADNPNPNPSLALPGGHEYMIVDANTWNGTLTLYNPWGVTRPHETNGLRVISYNDFRDNFSMINVA